MVITNNKQAHFNYHIISDYKCGIELLGWEVKSIRQKQVQINTSHAILKKGEVWLIGSIIHPMLMASSHVNTDPTRSRKLLLKKSEIRKLIGQVERKGCTLVPIKLFWEKNLVKLQIGLAQGKKEHDKRRTIKERDLNKEQRRFFKKTI
jgi:SsrA-binding protein